MRLSANRVDVFLIVPDGVRVRLHVIWIEVAIVAARVLAVGAVAIEATTPPQPYLFTVRTIAANRMLAVAVLVSRSHHGLFLF